MRNDRGVSLMEMMIVVLIVGMLAAMAWPSFTKVKEQAYKRDAKNVLLAIYAAERAYFFAKKTYSNSLDFSHDNATWRQEIGLDDPNESNTSPVAYAVVGGATMVATATRDGSHWMSVDDTRTLVDNWTIP